VTAKEMKEFNICPDYQGKKLAKEFREYGRRADLNDLSSSLTPKSGTPSTSQSSDPSRSASATWTRPSTPST
jgi:hypothetical protein